MTTPIAIPKLGWEMREGTLVGWLVSDGSAVSEGDPLYVVETDKIETEVAAAASGVLRCLGVVGETYPVGHQIGSIE